MSEVKLEERTDELEGYKGKWRGLWFTKDGQSFPDLVDAFDTEDQAKADINDGIEHLRAARNHRVVLTGDDAVWVTQETFSHAIPMPVGDQ